MTRPLKTNEIEYIVSAIGNFRIKHNPDDNYILEEHRHKLRVQLTGQMVKNDDVVIMIRERVRGRFLECLMRPLSPAVVDAGSSIMASIIQTVLNSHKNAGSKTTENSGREILVGALKRSNEHLHVRLKDADFDRLEYEKYARRKMKTGKYNYRLLGFDNFKTVMNIPYADQLTDYEITYPGLHARLSIESIYNASLDPVLILKDLRAKLTDVTVIGLHEGLSFFDIYFFSSTFKYIELLILVKDVLTDDNNKGKFDSYKILEKNLSTGITRHTDDTDKLGMLIANGKIFYIGLKLGALDIAVDTYIKYLESKEAVIYGFVYDKAGSVVGIRYTAEEKVDFTEAVCYRLNLYGITSEFYNMDDKIDISHSYCNNIYILATMLGIASLVPHFAKEWYPYESNQNVLMFVSAFMFIGPHINPIKHSSIAERGPLSAMSEHAKKSLTTTAYEAKWYPIVGPQASVAVGAPLLNSGMTAVELA